MVGVYLTLFLGIIGITQMVASEDADTVLTGINYTAVYGWNATLQMPLVHLPDGSGTFQNMDAGQGYWVYVNEELAWTY